MRRSLLFSVLLFPFVGLGQDRPPVFFREDFKETPAALPVTQEHIANANLELKLYGAGPECVKKSHHDTPKDDPFYLWSGECLANWAVALRHRTAMVDLTGLSKIRWRSKQAGYRYLRVILKLASGDWIVGDIADGPTNDWRVTEFNLSEIRWRSLDIGKIVEGKWVAKPDLASVDEIGFTDLMIGGRSDACSRLDWIEVHGVAAPRGSARRPSSN